MISTLLLVALSQTPQHWLFRQPNLPTASYAFLEFAPASGAGLVSAANLCDTLTAAEKASVMPDGGSGFWCLNGDATMDPASTISIVAPTDAGTTLPSPVTMRVCPNGPDCGSKSALEFSATLDTDQQGYRQTSTSNPFGANDWTLCQHLQFGADWATASYENTVFHGVGANIDVLFQRQTGSGIVTLYSTGLSRGTYTAVLGGPLVMCMTRVDSSQRIRTYANGTSVYDTSSTGVAAGTTSIWKVGGYDAASAFPIKKGTRVFGTFFVNTALSDARIAAIARAVLADAPTGARGEALSETRASVQFCESSDGTGTLLPNNRPCITRGGTTAAQGAFTQYALRTEELDNAGWSDVGTPTVTANSTVSAGGTLTADTIDDNDAAAFEGRSQSVTVTAAAAYTMSCYAKAGTLAKIRLSLDGTTGDTTTLSSSSWTRVSVTDASTSGVSVSAQVLAGTATTDTGTVIVWGCNVTPGSSVRPYTPATSAAVTTAAEVPYLTLTNAPALNSIEATASFPATFAATARVMSVYKDANNAFDMYVDTTASNKLNCLATVGGVTYSGLSTAGVTASTTQRLSCSYDGTSVIACIDGTCNSTARAFTMFSAATRVYLGTYATTGAEINPSPVVTGVKADPSASRFR